MHHSFSVDFKVRCKTRQKNEYIVSTFTSGVVVSLRASERKVWSSKLYRNTIGIRQEGHPEIKVLRCYSTKSDSKASV